MRAMPAFLWSSVQGGLLDGGCLPSLTFLHCHLVDVRGGSVLELDHLSFKQLLVYGDGNGEEWARPRKGLKAPACF